MYHDQTGRSVFVASSPKRIISLVPSQTELLYHLGLSDEVVAITKFCIHPDSWYRTKPRIGGTKNVDINAVRSLQPDLVIANKEENLKEQVEAIAMFAPVWTSDIARLGDAFTMIAEVGRLTDRAGEATALLASLRDRFEGMEKSMQQKKKIRAAYLIWRDPWMSVGGDTFISDMLSRAGFENVFGELARYPVVTVEAIKEAGAELVLLSSEPYPFAAKHREELSAVLPYTAIQLVDGEIFSWYGSRLLQAKTYIDSLRASLEGHKS